VGDIGEFYAAQRLGLSLSTSKVQKGIDATHVSGLTFEIKTRRVYQSGRRTGEARRLNNLSEKEADYLIVVTLDRAFQCSGMWLIPMTNIINPKQANLKIVNDTPGVLNLIPSQIPWLKTGTPFEAFQIPKPKQKKEVKNRQNSKEASATYSPSKRPKVKMQINEPDRYLPKSQPSSDGLLWLILIISIVLIMMYL
jgi:hypothetical protein